MYLAPPSHSAKLTTRHMVTESTGKFVFKNREDVYLIVLSRWKESASYSFPMLPGLEAMI